MNSPKVIRGQCTLTLGFQAGIRDEKQDSPLGQVLERLNCTPMGESATINHQPLPLNYLLPDWSINLSKSDFNSEIREYLPKSSKGLHDEFSSRLFIRKSDLLTSKGRHGLISVKLLDIEQRIFSKLCPIKGMKARRNTAEL